MEWVAIKLDVGEASGKPKSVQKGRGGVTLLDSEKKRAELREMHPILY
jgi:hypothetical protein